MEIKLKQALKGCPNCGSEDIRTTDNSSDESKVIFRERQCWDCELQWTEYLQVVAIDFTVGSRPDITNIERWMRHTLPNISPISSEVKAQLLRLRKAVQS